MLQARADGLQVPTSCIPWPTQGLRRISVDSFGFGGANSHIILDDAFHTIEALNLNTFSSPSLLTSAPEKPTDGINGTNGVDGAGEVDAVDGVNHAPGKTSKATREYQLLTWSARDEAALKRMLHLYDGYLRTNMHADADFLGDLAYTLAARRTLMAWRSFSVAHGQGALETLDLPAAKCERAARDIGVAFVFTGQGVQYANMGMELLGYPIFRATLAEADGVFQELGAEWSLFGKHSTVSLVRH
jgi:acyl transferase domain-containing protein